MITKEKVIEILEEIAVLLELAGENPFKSRAYTNAARNLEKTEADLHDLARRGKLSEIQGIGDAIGRKLSELLSTGKLDYYEKLKASIPPGHLQMLKISGMGPKKIHALYKNLGITTVDELEEACRKDQLLDLAGFGKKTQNNILAGIERFRHYSERRLYPDVLEDAVILLAAVRSNPNTIEADIAGSLRRGYETIKDIDILASTRHPEEIAEAFASDSHVAKVTARGDTKISVVLKSGVNADLRMVTPAEYPYALHHFTGSREHNTAMRGRAREMGLKMNEYGLFRGKKNIVCRSEKEIFNALGLQYIEPELRENMGEIEAAEKGDLPLLIRRADIQGVFHIHTSSSDGADSLKSIAKAAQEIGLKYIGISDHSRSAAYAGGLKIEDIEKQHAAIDEFNKKSALRIFKGIESDILPDGSLDYEDEVLCAFDFVIAAVHSHFHMNEKEMTARICKALSNPNTTMLAHPSGRLLLSREAYAVDVLKVIDTAADYGKALELNVNPHRYDLDWRHCMHAKNKGVKIAINPDAHSAGELDYLDLGVKIARKGWLTREDCLNTFSLAKIQKFLTDRHSSVS